jgi:hypothetical protein
MFMLPTHSQPSFANIRYVVPIEPPPTPPSIERFKRHIDDSELKPLPLTNSTDAINLYNNVLSSSIKDGLPEVLRLIQEGIEKLQPIVRIHASPTFTERAGQLTCLRAIGSELRSRGFTVTTSMFDATPPYIQVSGWKKES